MKTYTIISMHTQAHLYGCAEGAFAQDPKKKFKQFQV